MNQNSILNNLGRDERIAILSRQGELYLIVHGTADPADRLAARAARDGSEILAAYLDDMDVINEFIADRERDIGGEG